MQLCNEPQNSTPAVANCLERYGNRLQFGTTFNAGMIAKYSAYPERCIRGSAPTINIVKQAYGTDALNAWLILTLEYINKMSGVKTKLDELQLEALSSAIIANEDFQALKVTDIMLFVNQFVTGKYGHFYGAVDAQVIGQALYQYIAWRRQQLSLFAREEFQQHQRLQREQWLNDPRNISRETYLHNELRRKQNLHRKVRYRNLAQKRVKFSQSPRR